MQGLISGRSVWGPGGVNREHYCGGPVGPGLDGRLDTAVTEGSSSGPSTFRMVTGVLVLGVGVWVKSLLARIANSRVGASSRCRCRGAFPRLLRKNINRHSVVAVLG